MLFLEKACRGISHKLRNPAKLPQNLRSFFINIFRGIRPSAVYLDSSLMRLYSLIIRGRILRKLFRRKTDVPLSIDGAD